MEACVGAHHLSRKLKALGHDARLMPAKYVRPYSKGQKNDFRDAEAIAERSDGWVRRRAPREYLALANFRARMSRKAWKHAVFDVGMIR